MIEWGRLIEARRGGLDCSSAINHGVRIGEKRGMETRDWYVQRNYFAVCLTKRDNRMTRHPVEECLVKDTGVHDDGHRNGLIGGNRHNGGSANVDNDHRDNRNDNKRPLQNSL